MSDDALYEIIYNKLILLRDEMWSRNGDEDYMWHVPLPNGKPDSLSVGIVDYWTKVMRMGNPRAAVNWGEALPLCNAIWRELK